MIKAVVMAGGSGTRLWPLSTSNMPKQFLRINNKESLLQLTIKRLDNLEINSFITICNEEHRFFVLEQLKEKDKIGSIILEPIRKNTAPAIAIAALLSDDEDLLLVLSADHIVEDNINFAETVNKAIPLAEAGKLVTFGVIPDKANSGYGYIKRGKIIGDGFNVDKFIEKPPQEVAQVYVESEDYFWNSGIFLFKSSKYLNELKKFRPDIYQLCLKASKEIEIEKDFMRINKDIFSNCPSESVDRAVMEQTKDAVVIPLSAGWSDIGSWSSLWDHGKKDDCGNVVDGDAILLKSKNCYVSSNSKLVSILDVNDLVIVDTKEALMVANKDSVQDVKILVEELKRHKRNEWKRDREVYRPWGKYDLVDVGDGYQVKRLTVKPGAKLSLQKHSHRAEHWIVVSGKAKVTKGNEIFILSENESTFIPIGMIHSLENAQKEMLEIIEVQSGSYLGEDDIVRFNDMYGRTKD